VGLCIDAAGQGDAEIPSIPRNEKDEKVRRMMRTFSTSRIAAFALVTALAGLFAAGAPTTATAQAVGKTMTTSSGLQITDTKIGTGATPQPGQICVMHYTGWLYQNGAKGKKFDSSLDRGQPFEFPLGKHQVIAGWDEGVATMKIGGKRTLIIPPELGYGARGAGGVIPPNATLLFEVELLDVKG
jgi:peptidylprolyl isomerase